MGGESGRLSPSSRRQSRRRTPKDANPYRDRDLRPLSLTAEEKGARLAFLKSRSGQFRQGLEESADDYLKCLQEGSVPSRSNLLPSVSLSGRDRRHAPGSQRACAGGARDDRGFLRML